MTTVHKLIAAICALLAVVSAGLAVFNAAALNHPDAPGILSSEGAKYVGIPAGFALSFGMYFVGHLLIVLARGSLAKQEPTDGIDAATKATLAAFGKHMSIAAAKGDLATVQQLHDAEAIVLGKGK